MPPSAMPEMADPADPSASPGASLPAFEDDLAEPGILDPVALYPPGDVPDTAVICFFPETVERIGHAPGSSVSLPFDGFLGSRNLYEREHRGRRVAFFYPSVGAPRAAMYLEEAIARGCRHFIAVGSAGVLVPELVMGHPFVVTSAVRDEGTSAHYLPPGAVVEAPPEGVTALVETLTEAGVAFEQGRTWTTDAIYRETRSRVQRRIAQGCAVVEMEAAAFFAVAAYRGVSLGQMLFSADSLAGDAWDHRSWHRAQDAHEAVFWLAMDAAVRLAEQGSAGEPYVPARVGEL